MSEARIAQLKSFLEADPTDTFTSFALALEYIKHERENEALEIFANILRNNPDYSGVYYHLGKLYEKQGKQDDAVRIYSEGIVICRQKNELHALQELQQALDEALDSESDD